LGWPAKTLEAARATLYEHGDRLNAAHARHLEVRRLLLIGRLNEAEPALAELDPASLPPTSGPPTSWSLRKSQYKAFGARWCALRSLVLNMPRARQGSLH
jgi:hypothetical protein